MVGVLPVVPLDGNGLSDDWDGDGFIDLYEFLAGTNPTNPASLLVISSLVPASESGQTITWQSASNRFYITSGQTHLSDGVWTPVVSNILKNAVARFAADTRFES